MNRAVKMATTKLQNWFPWVSNPMIANGPMMGVVGPKLAVEVTKAGGLGFNSCVAELEAGSAHLQSLDDNLTECRTLLGSSPTDPLGRLRVGAGFVTGDPSIGQFTTTALPILQRHRPCAVWLFAPSSPENAGEPSHHSKIIKAIKEGLNPAPQVFVQVGNVKAAREAVEEGADVLVCQGIDAGGHQFRKGMGVVSLVPEVSEMLEEMGKAEDVAVIAAGGIVCGKGVAAVMALGADGVVMGTRFTVCEESLYPSFRKEAVLATRDGGSNTWKHHFHDEVRESKLWGPEYDGRAIITEVHQQFMRGERDTEACIRMMKEEYTEEQGKRLLSTWAGTGVGRVNKAMPAGEVVKEVVEEARATARRLAGQFA